VPSSVAPSVPPGARRVAGAPGGAGAAGGAGAGGMLPVTGADAERMVKIGVASTALGWALVGISRLRRPFQSPPEDPPAPAGDKATG
jgi:hypothetical protein